MRSWAVLVLCIATAVVSPSAAAKKVAPPLEGQKRILVLPLEFVCFEEGLASFEPMPERTAQAMENLNASLARALRREKRLEFVPMPALNTEESAALAEHVALLGQASASALTDLQIFRVPWSDRARGRMEYSIGNGLAFLAERTGTEFAVLVSGGRSVPSAGRVIATVGVAVAFGYLPIGTDKALMATVIELKTGDMVSVFLETRKLESEPYYVPGANTWMRALFDSFPDKPRNKAPRKSAPKQKPIPRYESSFGFSFVPPRGWHVDGAIGRAGITRHSAGLEHVHVDREYLKGAETADFVALGRKQAERIRKLGVLPKLEIVAVEAATVSGRPGFQVEMRSERDFLGTPIRFRHHLYGIPTGDHIFLLQYDAPAIHYFDRYLPQAESTLATLKVR